MEDRMSVSSHAASSSGVCVSSCLCRPLAYATTRTAPAFQVSGY
jgi:hypothetical protein